MVSIYAENIDFSNPISFDGSAVEGNIEDTASNLPSIVARLSRSASNIIDLYSTQAVDLCKAQQTNVKLSEKRKLSTRPTAPRCRSLPRSSRSVKNDRRRWRIVDKFLQLGTRSVFRYLS